jgi:hypothetical protein
MCLNCARRAGCARDLIYDSCLLCTVVQTNVVVSLRFTGFFFQLIGYLWLALIVVRHGVFVA